VAQGCYGICHAVFRHIGKAWIAAVNTFFGITLIAAAPAAWIYLRSRRESSDGLVDKRARGSAAIAKARSRKRVLIDENATPGASSRRHFKATSIHKSKNCCHSATELHGKRFLLEEVPKLPLETCDRIGECECVYRNHADRRGGDDRRNVYGALSKAGEIGMKGVNKRTGMDRRACSDDEFDNIEFEN
jgi:hypothetical protein